ncbi:MAG: O-antigen ligase family protein [Steroidobacteraceae bacterium]
MQVAIFVRPDTPTAFLLHDSATNMLRRAFLFMLDIYVLYFAVSRSCASKAKILDAMAAFCAISCVMALEAVFETLRQWLLYHDMALQLDPADVAMRLAYLLRGGALRAQAAAGHALSLGYLLAVAFGFWLYLRPHVESKLKGVAVPVLLWAGLFAAYSRGPWMGAVTIYFVTVLLSPRAFGRLARAAAIVLGLSVFVVLTPLGERITKVLPFIGGSVDASNLDYRHRLAVASWDLIVKHPFFGDQDFISKMQQLRQGQGIIDIVNTYAGTALEYGLVGLGIFVGFMLLCALKGYRFMADVRQYDGDLAGLGSCLLACVAGTLVMIYNSSLVYGYEKMFYVLAGLTTAYFRYCMPAAMTTAKDSKLQVFEAPHPI